MFRLAILTFAYVATLFTTLPDGGTQYVVTADVFEEELPQYRVPAHVPVDHNEWSEMGDLDLLWPHLIPYYRDLYGPCGEFRDIALQVGWQPDEWPKLGRIIARETGRTCDPTVLNDNAQTGDLSFGLTQINMRGKLGPDRLLRCSLTKFEDLWDPATNLRCARVLFERAGWEPWRMPGT